MACPYGFSFDADNEKKIDPAFRKLVPGDKFRCWDTKSTWTENHILPSRLEEMRTIGDDLADEVFLALGLEPKQDALEALIAYTSRPECEQESSSPRLLMEQLTTIPEWVDWNAIESGQKVFKYVFMSLVHIYSSGYMGLQDHQKNLRPITGEAWESIVRIRLLHAGVRCRLRRIACSHPEIYDLGKFGVPINQEDMHGTIYSFTSLVWSAMQRKLGVSMTVQEREDYMHVWRYIGYLIGVDDKMGYTHSEVKSLAGAESVAMHVLDPDESSGKLITALISSVSIKVPLLSSIGMFPDTFRYNLALSESLFGPEFWDLAKLPHAEPRHIFLKDLIVNLLHFDQWLGDHIPFMLQFRDAALYAAIQFWISCVIGNGNKFDLKFLPTDPGHMSLDTVDPRNQRNQRNHKTHYWIFIFALLVVVLGIIYY
ncbi:hypothetical protein BGZ76_011094 [Entomortierella beljakovae]|nr:hypothetical protein BGZ76_011094 [Entomortierella beljakovae]